MKIKKNKGKLHRLSGGDLQKQSTKHLNVSLKNRMGTESHGGDGGLLEDREDGEDGEDDRPKATIRRTDTETLSASVPAAVRAVRGSVRLHPRSSSSSSKKKGEQQKKKRRKRKEMKRRTTSGRM